jgi:DNA mismatch repair ATPase MutS
MPKDEMVGIAISVAFYIFNVWQYYKSITNFYKSMMNMDNHIIKIKEIMSKTISNMDIWLTTTAQYKSKAIRKFNEKVNETKMEITRRKEAMFTKFEINMDGILNIGKRMKHFYDFINEQTFHECITYCVDFNIYMESMRRISEQTLLHNATYTNIYSLEMRGMKYYPIVSMTQLAKEKEDNVVANDVDLSKPVIITGANASGKTTIMKTILLNTIWSQQYGMGCYERMKFKPYSYFHCYINIPDTLNRDSLFQSEARRCKHIIDVIKRNGSKKGHLCIFDELYSGTNTKEAIASAVSLIKYLAKYPNVQCVITTHYTEICEMMKKDDNVMNMCMESEIKEEKITHTYEIKEGISMIKGGIIVLNEMEYPKEIIADAKQINKE